MSSFVEWTNVWNEWTHPKATSNHIQYLFWSAFFLVFCFSIQFIIMKSNMWPFDTLKFVGFFISFCFFRFKYTRKCIRFHETGFLKAQSVIFIYSLCCGDCAECSFIRFTSQFWTYSFCRDSNWRKKPSLEKTNPFIYSSSLFCAKLMQSENFVEKANCEWAMNKI